MEYSEVLNNLSISINTNRKTKLFGESLKDLKNLGFEVSTKFLRELVINSDVRYKTYRIAYLLRVNELKTERTQRFYNCWEMNKYKVDVVEWARDLDKKVYPSEFGLTDEEVAQIGEIKAIGQEHGIYLFNPAEENHKNRNLKRRAFNMGGKPFIKNVSVVDVGRFFRVNKKEVLFMVVVR